MYFLFIITAAISTNPLYVWQSIVDMKGSMPTPRGGHSMTQVGRLLYVFGGCDVIMQCYNDLHTYNTDTQVWSRIDYDGDPPSARGGHTATLLGTRLIIFGGSARGQEYNDLYEYNTISNAWKNLLPYGERPNGRSNHAADLDSDGNLVIVAGFSTRGYLNDVWVYNPAYNLWVQFETAGEAPTPRELHSFNIRGKAGYMYGGFHSGGVSSELYVLDLELMTWSRPADDGYLPEGREGHISAIISEYLYIFGGCDFGLNTCYNYIYVLDLLSLWWTKLQHRRFTPLPPIKERLGAAVVGSSIYIFGGCYLNKYCYNDFMTLDTGVNCDCSSNGLCRDGLCVCYKGYTASDCSVRPKCKENCLYRGFCTSSGLCDCYPGYKGTICEYESLCPNNCTGVVNGRCQTNGVCLCNAGYSGSDCKCTCVNGYCVNGACLCNVGWTGVKCDTTDSSFNSNTTDVSNNSTAQNYTDTDQMQNITDASDQSNGNQTGVETIQGLNSTQDSNNTLIDYDVDQNSNNYTQPTQNTTQMVRKSNQDSPAYTQNTLKIITCDLCGHGICLQKICYCDQGWTGTDCNENIAGMTTKTASYLVLISILLGMSSGYLYFCYKKVKDEPEEYPLID